MFKVTPNPPKSGHKSRVEAQEEKKLDDAATRALDYYLNPKPASPPEPDSTKLFIVAPHIDTETLLATLPKTCSPSAPSPPIWLTTWMTHAAVSPWRSVVWPMGCSCWLSGRWIIWKPRRWRRLVPRGRGLH
jgi:hypothetical protein